MIFNTVQEAKWQVKNNIRARIMDYKENLVNKFKETFKEVADKGKEEVINLLILLAILAIQR